VRLKPLRLTASGILSLVVGLGVSDAAGVADRSIPHSLPSHPGNIFLTGEKIVIHAPGREAQSWRTLDYEGKTVAQGNLTNGLAEVGTLPPGWYELAGSADPKTNGVFLGVIEPLHAPTPTNSPICIDVAMAWMFPKEKMGEVANLCQLAGINRVRDRLLWEVMEPKRGEFVHEKNQYDASAQIQSEAGLQVLQVGHVSASWANPVVKRLPLDLRDAYNFYREMAHRWQGQVGAFEPWNEADITEFGGHTGCEMASYQKAAYLGLKAGNPRVTACLNPFAIRRQATLNDFQQNQAWPYFDTYNFHHYETLDKYPALYAAHREGSGGKPMWVSECSVHVNWQGNEALKELSEEDLRLQSERVTKTYTLGIYQGAASIFYFMLPHYTERQLQYGLLRPDLTPRPGYLAVAAAGRLLAGARPLGRVELEGKHGQAYFFHAEPDGVPAEVMVVWAKQETPFELKATPRGCFDHLGRPHPVSGKTIMANQQPLYVVLANGALPTLIPPPKPAKLLTDKPGFAVLQPVLPAERTVLQKSAFDFPRGQTEAIPVFLYNFGTEKLRGKVSATVPEGWKAELPSEVTIAPGERKPLNLRLTSPGNNWEEARVRVSGEFGVAEHPLLSMKFVPK
jgi:hypothetical protein